MLNNAPEVKNADIFIRGEYKEGAFTKLTNILQLCTLFCKFLEKFWR